MTNVDDIETSVEGPIRFCSNAPRELKKAIKENPELASYLIKLIHNKWFANFPKMTSKEEDEKRYLILSGVNFSKDDILFAFAQLKSMYKFFDKNITAIKTIHHDLDIMSQKTLRKLAGQVKEEKSIYLQMLARKLVEGAAHTEFINNLQVSNDVRQRLSGVDFTLMTHINDLETRKLLLCDVAWCLNENTDCDEFVGNGITELSRKASSIVYRAIKDPMQSLVQSTTEKICEIGIGTNQNYDVKPHTIYA